jgi:hypothetical protein
VNDPGPFYFIWNRVKTLQQQDTTILGLPDLLPLVDLDSIPWTRPVVEHLPLDLIPEDLISKRQTSPQE